MSKVTFKMVTTSMHAYFAVLSREDVLLELLGSWCQVAMVKITQLLDLLPSAGHAPGDDVHKHICNCSICI